MEKDNRQQPKLHRARSAHPELTDEFMDQLMAAEGNWDDGTEEAPSEGGLRRAAARRRYRYASAEEVAARPGRSAYDRTASASGWSQVRSGTDEERAGAPSGAGSLRRAGTGASAEGGRAQPNAQSRPSSNRAGASSARTAGGTGRRNAARVEGGREDSSGRGTSSGNKGSGGGARKRTTAAQREARRKALRKKRRRRVLLVIASIFLVLFAAAAIFLVSKGYAGKVIALHDEAVELVKNATADTFSSSRSTQIYAADGTVLIEMGGAKDIIYLDLDQIPDTVKYAFVSTEDKRFYRHPGFDLKGIARAVVWMIRDREVSGGGSTITQQLARNIFLSHEQSWERKVEEIFIAIELEKKFSKDEILTFYINNIYYMNGFYGIEAASEGYFSKPASELTLAEAAFLCAIPNSPTYYDPFEHMDRTMTRERLILGEMLEDGRIDHAQYAEAMAQEIVLNPQETEEVNYNFMATYGRFCAVRALMEASGFEFRYEFGSDEDKNIYLAIYTEVFDSCLSSLYGGGYQVYTSLRPDLQYTLQLTVDSVMGNQWEKSEEGIFALQAAATCVDSATGMVVAIVGGRSQDELTGYTLNRAYSSYRQPGSTIKPLIVYTPAFERGYNPDSIVEDAKEEDGPRNATDRYAGNVTIRYAVQQSLNTVAWKLLREIGPAEGLSYLQRMRFAGLTSQDYTLASALGGMSNGVTTVEMASAYAALANEGVYRTATCVERVTDRLGTDLYVNDHAGTEVYQRESALEMTEVLETVLTDGTARGFGLGEQPSAGKTGTTNDNRDLWFCGYSPYYTTSVWVGYDTPRSMEHLSGTLAVEIWKSYMTAVHRGLAVAAFNQSEYGASAQAAAAQAAEAARQRAAAQAAAAQAAAAQAAAAGEEDQTTAGEDDETDQQGASGGETSSGTETPDTETPAAETPAAETPAAEIPAETPPAETPPAETPAAETPAAQTPATETPPAETPAAETSAE